MNPSLREQVGAMAMRGIAARVRQGGRKTARRCMFLKKGKVVAKNLEPTLTSAEVGGSNPFRHGICVSVRLELAAGVRTALHRKPGSRHQQCRRGRRDPPAPAI